MAKYPKYYKAEISGRIYLHAVLSPHRLISASHNKHRGQHILETFVTQHEVKKVMGTRYLKQIDGKEFYTYYLMVRRKLNKQCIRLIKSLNQKEQTQ